MRLLTPRKFIAAIFVSAVISLFFYHLTKSTWSVIEVFHFPTDSTIYNFSLTESATWWKMQDDACDPLLIPNYVGSLNHSFALNAKLDALAQAQICTERFLHGRHPSVDACHEYLMSRHFILKSMSEEERRFPLAYSIVAYKDYPQVEQLIRTIYRPEHSICIHVDEKADEAFLRHLQHLVECFREDEIFIAKKRVSVEWGKFSTLQADLICLEELWKLWRSRKWKYWINLTGQEYPLRTNLELVRILSLLNGTNAVEGLNKHQEFHRHPKRKLPFNFTWTKGAVHVVLTPAFVNFSLHDPKAVAIQKVLERDGQIPDELYFSTLNYNPHLGAPGAFLGDPETNPYFNRAKLWIGKKDIPSPRCKSGRIKRDICIIGMLDVPPLLTRRELFVNKLHWDFNNLASMCLQEWYWKRTRNESLSANHDIAIDLSWYSTLPMIRNHQ